MNYTAFLGHGRCLLSSDESGDSLDLQSDEQSAATAYVEAG